MEFLGAQVSTAWITDAVQLLPVKIVLQFWVVPATVISITGNVKPGIQKFKDISVKISTPVPFGPDHRV